MIDKMIDKNKRINPWLAIGILGLIGFARTVSEVFFNIQMHRKWYSLDTDVIFVMIFFVIHFCFFGSLILHLLLKVFREEVDFFKIFSFLFYIQYIHLIIPFIDKIGVELGIPSMFKIVPIENSRFFLAYTFMTFGIIVAWIIAGILALRLLIKDFRISAWKSIAVIVILFNVFYWPIYHFYNTFIALFNIITNNSFSPGNTWGYGIYFMSTSFLGILYYFKRKKYEF